MIRSVALTRFEIRINSHKTVHRTLWITMNYKYEDCFGKRHHFSWKEEVLRKLKKKEPELFEFTRCFDISHHENNFITIFFW